MPYERARRILSNFMPSSMPGGFGSALGVGLGFYSPEALWQQPSAQQAPETPEQTQPSQPPEGAAPAGRTGVQQGEGVPAPDVASPSPVYPSFGRETLRVNPYSAGLQQQGVKRPLSQARRYGL